MANNINTTLDDVWRSTAVGSIDNAIGNVFYGINHRQTPNPIPINKDNYGLTFFTRPQLNLTTQNLRSERRFSPLLTENEYSIQRIIRNTLDPRLAYGGFGSGNLISCPFVDNNFAFIPILTNHLLSCSGWPDQVSETYTSKPGAYKEVYGHVDSALDMYSAFPLTANFRNMEGDPITSLFNYWNIYPTKVFEGILSPYPDFIKEHEIDYNTRIYRLVLDKNKRFVQKIACTGAAFPTSVPFGSAFNFESDKPYNETNANITINFNCFGSCYNDDIIIYEFNKVVGIFNKEMATDRFGNIGNMKKVPSESLSAFNNKGYPRIDPYTKELEWYVSSDDFEQTIGAYMRHVDAIADTGTDNPLGD
jgi:hypothetical protein